MPENIREILNASAILKKRGPDDTGSYIRKDGIFIFKRLAINDLKEGRQPFLIKNTITMCNGEIYNHRELQEKYEIKCERGSDLRSPTKGSDLRSPTKGSDCEIIPRLYEKIGFAEMYKKLDGYFAIVLVDGENVFLARDRLGVRPLYIGELSSGANAGCLTIASTPEALLSFSVNVRSFPPGRCVCYNKRTREMKILWIDRLSLPKERIGEEPEKKIHDVLTRAVEKRLMSDRPIGCLLSGGLDSSIIAAILCKFLGAKNVRTYSIGMKGSTDLRYADMVAQHLGTNHTAVEIDFKTAFSAIPEVIREIASYDITTVRASVGMYLLAKYISQNTQDKVIFSGEGADELFCGYLYFHKAPSEEEAEKESVRLLTEMHKYDILRADRTVSSNGLELRVPFLDRDVVNTGLSLLALDKIPENYEKLVLRNAFAEYLPEKVLWRRKEGFSDGISSTHNSWYEQIQEKLEEIIPDFMFSPQKYKSKEAMYYRLIFESFFPNYPLDLPYWMPKWIETNDPSGRLIDVYDE